MLVSYPPWLQSQGVLRCPVTNIRPALETAATFSFVPGVSWSDHRSFWRQGYHSVMITDTAFYRYRHYHAPSDTPDKLAYPELARVTFGLFAGFSELARGGVD